MASRKIEDCTRSVQEKFRAFSKAMYDACIPFVITCTARNVDEQVALYAQGRKPLDEVNRLRVLAGLPQISGSQNNKVTWTLNSNHIVDLDDGNPNNDKSRAFDIALVKDKKAHWDIKADVNGDQIPDYIQAGRIGEACGLRWGGRFSNPDYSHFEDL